MNQILSVNRNGGGNSNKANIKSILIVFSIILILFGIGIASTGAYSYYKNIENNTDRSGLKVTNNNKPDISIEVQGSNSLNIVVTHDNTLKKVSYSINGGEEVEVNTNEEKKVEETIKLKSGTSDIIVKAEDINGISSKYEHTFTAEQKPSITLKQVEGKIQATIESEINIDTIQYYWDENIESAQIYTINDVKNVTLIDVLEGMHTLHIIAKDIEGNKQEEKQKIIGDTKPELTIKTDGKRFLISASDDEGLTKVEMVFNSGELQKIDINDATYSTSLDLVEGLNTLKVRIYNKNGVSNISKVQCTKE